MLNIVEHIKSQMRAVNLPLYAITLTAVPRPDTPVLLMLLWHAFRRDFVYQDTSATPVAFRPVPSSVLQVNERWSSLATIDFAAMEAGWELGAWDVSRQKRPACLRPGADSSEAIECMQAFGAYHEWMAGHDLVVADAPDMEDLFELGANVGYLVWKFAPVLGGVWAELAEDETLNADGSRDPTCPLLPEPAYDGVESRTTYRFGRRTIIH